MFQRFPITCLLAVVLSASHTNAQPGQPAYWVIESNIHSSDKTTIKVYNLVEQLIAQKEVQRRIDITRKKDRKMLDKFVKTTLKEQQAPVARRSRKSIRANALSAETQRN